MATGKQIPFRGMRFLANTLEAVGAAGVAVSLFAIFQHREAATYGLMVSCALAVMGVAVNFSLRLARRFW